jgi:hypothetical protein
VKNSKFEMKGELLSAVASTAINDIGKENTNFDHGEQLDVCILGGTQHVTNETDLVSVVVDLERCERFAWYEPF